MFSVAMFVLKDAQREKLKAPLGELIAGEPNHCIGVLKVVLESEKPRLLILVGDTVSRTAIQSGIKPSVIIIDGREKRRPATHFAVNAEILRTQNKPACIEQGAWNTVQRAIQKGNCAVLVDGEEDLLTLPAIMVAPLGSLVVYGQPNVGIVLNRVTPEKKREVQAFLNAMESID